MVVTADAVAPSATAHVGDVYARAGITSVVEPGLTPEDIDLLRRLGNEGALRQRVRMALAAGFQHYIGAERAAPSRRAWAPA